MFAITTNKQSFLKDPSGARRIVIIPGVGEAGPIDLKWFKETRPLILAPIIRRVKEAIKSGNTEGLSLLEPRFEQLSKKISLQYMDQGFYHEVVLTGCKDFRDGITEELSVQSVWDKYLTSLGVYDSTDHKRIVLTQKHHAGIVYALECAGYRRKQTSATTRTELWHATETTRLYFESMGHVEASTSFEVEDDDFDDIPF